MEALDCVVIGAGWYGLCAAKQYHAVSPDASLAIFDYQSTLGGTWAEERLYPSLKSNNLLGSYEYPDFPMDTETFGVQKNQHIPGHVIHKYHEAYAAKFGIADLIRFNTKVLSAEHQETDQGGWLLTVQSSGSEEQKLLARKLIFATGLTSQAFLPAFKGQEEFQGKIFHSKQFPQNSDTIKTAKSVTVFGGNKFAWDVVYAYATAGVNVNWVIRPSGHGPCWMAPSHVTPLKRWIEGLANTRFLTWFSPCIWGAADGYSGIRRFLHGTAIGRFLVNAFWKVMEDDVVSLNAYATHGETSKLRPWISVMHTGTSFGILNYDTNFFDVIKNCNVKIYISEVDHLSQDSVHLVGGRVLKSDVFVATTGWNHAVPLKLLPEGIEKDLGVPHRLSDEDPSYNDLIAGADKDIMEQFPRLKTPAIWNKNYKPLTGLESIQTKDSVTPYSRLTPFVQHRFMVPSSSRFLRCRDVAFVGTVTNFSNIITAHVQSLWVAAYFSGRLIKDPAAVLGNAGALQELQYQSVLHNRFGHWRYPIDWGDRYPSFIFDAVPYFDLLLRDLGLQHRRKKSFLAEITEHYGPRDYQDINDEWKRKYGVSGADL
ncbi:FAD/NAD(P)-binding domain-containing protein [Thozetella sp. PMI_491]|nr:FAD/NAD(P)-binding domain-containing protein [Thozetella sp. PMI_491]